MQINFELNNAHVCQDRICFQTPSVLIKNMSEQVILGMPFIAMIYPFKADLHSIKTNVMGVPINFQFASKFEVDICHRSMNCISSKTKHLNFLKQDVMYKRSLNNFLINCFNQKLLLFMIRLLVLFVLIYPMHFGIERNTLFLSPMSRIFLKRKSLQKLVPFK
jgi:hypothetical protein